MNVPIELIMQVRALYKNPTFYITINDHTSSTLPQHRGIRQGCPLSPYLFILCQAMLFEDVARKLKHPLKRMWPADFHDFFYADDTVLFASTAKELETYLAVLKYLC